MPKLTRYELHAIRPIRAEEVHERFSGEGLMSALAGDGAAGAWSRPGLLRMGSHFSRTAANSGRFFFETGSDGGRPSFSKFLYWPFCRMRKSRCGPVERPVLPTRPMVLPISTCSPLRTNMRDKCKYIVS